jgi:5-methylcytosine-specific restriction endonuclease McrA
LSLVLLDHISERNVFKFKLIAIEDVNLDSEIKNFHERRRIITTEVKLEVWKRDNGKCATCSAGNELHFDHILPFSKGGTSVKAENVQLLCARHNLVKSDK